MKGEGVGLRGVDFQLVASDKSAPAPLQVVLGDPKDQVHVSSPDLTVAGEGVARVAATLNGVEVFNRAERGPPRELSLSFPVTLREGKNVLLVTATDARGQNRQEARVIFRDRPAPPPVAPGPGPVTPPPAPSAPSPLQVAISSPRDQARADQESIALAGLASSSRGVTRVLVMLNGVEVARLEERAGKSTLPVNLPLKLREGQNTIVVTATDTAWYRM